jgi:hypothetical protein
MQQRRNFIKQAGLAAAGALLLPAFKTMAAAVPDKKKFKVLVRSGWQTVNIGDIGHTFGLLQLLQDYLPQAEPVLWIKAYDRGVEELLRSNYPALQIIKGKANETSPGLDAAFRDCAFMVHSSGPFVTADAELRKWWNETKKPFGVYGVSLDEVNPDLLALLNNAAFFYCRDTESLRYLKTLGCKCPVQGFTPDATFGIRIYNEAKAQQYLAETGLQKGGFICVIPRMRYTPYWQMVDRKPNEGDLEKQAISDAYKKRDAEKMRAVITSWVKETGLKVLICPEVTYQVEFSKETLYDPLPEDIRKQCVWRDRFWLPDEATSVYKQARAMVCCEPHSLIMAVANGIPSIHVKQSSDTRKGQMWRDIGLGDWYFLMDETPASQITTALMGIHHNYPDAVSKTNKANEYVKKVNRETLQKIKM